ncbi:response regulator [Frateuria terrea]|uniref:Response regulator receiver domain-containing protein n=1 Tax=Frateuria terrea TaxID=529704 RepID=A0A1H6QB43_9GAMM|nr:response regulator [Frateuria terrea]SEI38034.1 Response regulator receiver domain-containing protein [Frateuria terrea]SFP03592.1 Response regulator receiver domain-containing protein [Frateuria terrea]
MTSPHDQHVSNRREPTDRAPGASAAVSRASSSARSLAILLVEDDALIRMDAADMLRDLGHDVVEAEYGPDAIAVLEGQPVDVLVTDVGLPGMSGTDLADRARRMQPGIGLVFATGDAELESRGGHHGAVILCKPYDSASLAESLRRARG